VATDGAGNVYVADTLNSTIRKISSAGVVTTVVGVAGQEAFLSGALPGGLFRPLGVAVHGDTLYVTMYHGVVAASPLP
jgi:DNA-binding beta-propeller fold protein YncE